MKFLIINFSKSNSKHFRWFLQVLSGVFLFSIIFSGCSNHISTSTDFSQNNTSLQAITKTDSNPGGKPNPSDLAALNSRIVAAFTPESGNAFEYDPPTIVNGFIYIGTSTKVNPAGNSADVLAALPANFFYKMDTDFKIIWKYSLNTTQVDGGASLDSQGNIYFVTVDYSVNNSGDTSKNFITHLNLYSLSAEGNFRWKTPISAGNESWIHAMVNCAIGTDDTIYVGDSKLFAFDTVGKIKWQYPDDDRIIVGFRNSPIIDNDGNIYFVSPEPVDTRYSSYGTDVIRAYKFSPDTKGTPAWSVVLDNNILDNEGGSGGGGGKDTWALSSPAFTLGDKSFYSAVGNTVNRVDSGTGTILWSMRVQGATGAFKSSPAVDAQDNLYLGTKSNFESTLYGIKADGSGLLWERIIGADIYPSPLLGNDGNLYIGSETTSSGHIHVIDMKTGLSVWDTGFDPPMGDISFCSPALYQGYIYIGTFSLAGSNQAEALFKIKADAVDYLAGAAWPRFHGGNANNGRK